MTIENGVRILAGSMVLLSLVLTQYVHENFVWLTVFVGLNLIQSAFTGFCQPSFSLKSSALSNSFYLTELSELFAFSLYNSVQF
ncbi:DUF2892 domain-containing protein [Vibrio vulnificus]|nr:DUF2892 domain-containing protein [Vibrio vulnificus]